MIRKRLVVGFAVVVVGLLVARSPSFAELRPGAAPFSQSAKTLRAAANAAAADPQADAVVLLDEALFEVRNKMVIKATYHQIVKVQTERGVRNWAHFGRGWAPWYQERAVLDARVLDPEGTFHKLDTSTIELVAQPQGEDHTYSDWRELRAPLAAVHPGSVIETVTSVVSTRPYATAGDVEHWYMANNVPTLATRIVIDSARKLDPKIYLAPNISKVTRRKGKNFHYVYSHGRFEAYEYEANQPGDMARVPLLAFSTGGSWSALAREYSGTIDRQIAEGALSKSVLPRKGKSRHETIASALEVLHKRVRYTGLEFGKNATVPWTPAETWKRQFGDCKDKATTLVAMLRSAGIAAHVALLRSGFGLDVSPEVPGMGGFNHAIVYVPSSRKGEQSYWIDATEELASLGQVGSSVQGRLALVASKSTRKLTRIPVASSLDNRIVEERKIVLPGYGVGSIEEVTHFYGTRELDARYSYRDRNDKKLREDIEAYVADYYKAPTLESVSSSDAQDMHTPLRLSLLAREAGVTYAGTHEAGVYINRYGLFDLASPELMSVANEKEHLRKRIEARKKPLRVFPFHKEWQYRIEHPPGYEAKTLPRDQDRMLGAVRFRQVFRVKKGYLQATFSVSLDKDRLTAAEVNATRLQIAKLLDGPALQIRLHHDAMSLWERGKVQEAVAALRANHEQRQSSEARADEDGRMVQVLLNLGLNADATRIGKRAQAAAPKSPLVAEVLTYSLEHSDFGRYLGEGASRQQALEAYERAIALVPDNERLRGLHGKLLLRDDRGRRYEGDIDAAIPELKVAMEAEQTGYDWLYVRAMYRAGHYKELLDIAREANGYSVFSIARLATTFHVSGLDAMLETAREKDIDDAVLRRAIDLLVDSRDYPAARALVPLVSAGTEPDPWLAAVKELQRYEDIRRSSKAKAVIVKALRDLDSSQQVTPEVHAMPPTPGQWKMLEVALRRARGRLPEILRDNSRVLADLLALQLEVVEEDASGPWRRVQFRLGPKDFTMTVYLAKRGRRLHLLSTDWFTRPAMLAALESLDRGKVSEAESLVGWSQPSTDEGEENRGSELFGEGFVSSRVARSLKNEPAARRLRWHVAAVLRAQADLSRPGADLAECAAAGFGPCSEALVYHWSGRGDYAKALEVLASMEPLAKTPGERVGLALRRISLTSRGGDAAKAEALAVALENDGELTDSQRGQLYAAWAESVSGQGRHAEGDAILRKGMQAGYGISANNLGWQQLFVEGHPRIDEAVGHARRAGQDAGSLHTLAALLAAKGDNKEAMDVIASAQGTRGRVLAIDWLVYGRVAANLGFVQSARDAYARVYDDDDAGDSNSWVSTARLARLWSKELAAR